jgi:hypothetical protein
MWLNKFECEPYGARGMFFYEPLVSKAPRAGVKPYCCLVDQVIFYAYPYYIKPGSGGFMEYGRCTHEWNLLGQRFMDGDGWNCLAALVLQDGIVYELAGGRVVRRNKRWCMEWLGWKVSDRDWRWSHIQKKVEEVPHG